MNDYWNDPPECADYPECCDEEMECLECGDLICHVCGKKIEPQPDVEPLPEIELPDDYFDRIEPDFEMCRHGNFWGDCGACDHEGDLAYDALRESKFRR